MGLSIFVIKMFPGLSQYVLHLAQRSTREIIQSFEKGRQSYRQSRTFDKIE